MRYLILSLFLLISLNLQAQQDSTDIAKEKEDIYSNQDHPDCNRRLNMIVTNPARYMNFYNISYYRKLACFAVLGGGLMTPSASNLNGWGANLEYRHYFFNQAFPGFYIAPRLAYHSWSSDEAKEDKTLFTFGAVAAWQFLFAEQWALGMGFGVEILSDSQNQSSVYNKYTGTVPLIRIELGYAF